MSDQNYIISKPECGKSTQLCHGNPLKPYFARALQSFSYAACVADSAVPVKSDCIDIENALDDVEQMSIDCFKNSQTLVNVDKLFAHLPAACAAQLTELINSFPCLFSDSPTRSHLIEHDIIVGDDCIC